MRIIVGVTGASGTIYGWRLLEKLRAREDAEIHLVLTRSGERTAFLELGKTAADFKALADCSYPVEDIGCRGERLFSDRLHGNRALLGAHDVSYCGRDKLKLDDPRG